MSYIDNQIRLGQETISQYLVYMNKEPEKANLYKAAINDLKANIKSMKETINNGVSGVR